MRRFVNPGNTAFEVAVNSQIYVDKTGLLAYANDYPALVTELKWNKNAQTALNQIKEKQYPQSLLQYTGQIILIGINYDKKTKEHSCKIERFERVLQ